MYYGKLISLDAWRNFVPYAPNIEVQAKTGQPFDIPLQDWILQGARDVENYSSPDPEVLSKIDTQRGWRLNPIITYPPARGFAVIDTAGPSLVYTSRSGFIGQDCFNYALSNGTQKSLQAQILIDVIQWYGIEFVDLVKDENFYHVEIQDYKPIGEPEPLFSQFFWYLEDYKEVVKEDGRNKVFTKDKLIAQTTYKSDSTTGYYPRIYNPAKKHDFELQTDSGIQGYIEDSNIPYRPTGIPYNIKVVQRLYFDHRVRYSFDGYQNGKPIYREIKQGLDYSKYTDYTFRISDKYGSKWWKSGNINHV